MTKRKCTPNRESASEVSRLEREGWVRRNIACEPRLSEIVETYRSLGFEVRLVPALTVCRAGATGCSSCFDADGGAEHYRAVFTRPRNAS
ncbi:hypothetical protein [Deferrisoma palaeochoriense]